LFADADHLGGGILHINVPLSVSRDFRADASLTYLSGGSVTAGRYQRYLGPVDLCVDTELTAQDTKFSSTINDTIPGQAGLIVNGPAHFNDEIGGAREVEYLRVNGPTDMNAGLVRTKRYQRYFGPMDLGSDTLMQSTNAGEVRFGDTVDGARSLRIETAGLTRFDGEVGGATKLHDLTTDVDGTTQIGADMRANTMQFGDPVTLAADVILNGRDSVTFIQSVTGHGHDLEVDSKVSNFFGDVLGVDVLKTDSTGHTLLGAGSQDDDGIIEVEARIVDFNDDVYIKTDASVTGKDWVDFGKRVNGGYRLWVFSDHRVRFGGDVGTEDALARLEVQAGTPDILDENVLIFDGEHVLVNGDILLNPQGRVKPGEVASIAGRNPNGLTIESLDGDILIGPDEKFTTLGDMTLSAEFGRITVGDLNAWGDINVISDDIVIRARTAGGEIRESDGGFIEDDEADLIASGDINFSSVPSLHGAGDVLVAAGGNASSTLDALPKRVKPLTLDNFTYGGKVLDLQPGAGGGPPPPPPPPPPGDDGGDHPRNPRQIDDLATELPPPPPRFKDKVRLDPFAMREISNLGLTMRPMNNAELVGAASSGREWYKDIADNPSLGQSDYEAVTNRLRRPSVLKSLDVDKAIFSLDTVNDQTGEVTTQDLHAELKSAFARAWGKYATAQQATTQPEERKSFREYLADDPEEVKTLATVYELEELMDELRIMGATPLEQKQAVRTVLGPITPEGVSTAEFAKALDIEVQESWWKREHEARN
ncbi:MAG TPA: hypothetical protein VG711_10170, partial [Phycisphaerales bacterium]|nr:hypothetical protein [Phycisphaerales bacterium]